MNVLIADCCVDVCMDAEPLLEVAQGDVDPFTGEEVVWPAPRVYWSNGAITDGHWTRDEFDG